MKKVIEDIIFLSKESQKEYFRIWDRIEDKNTDDELRRELRLELRSPAAKFCEIVDVGSGGFSEKEMKDHLCSSFQENFQLSKEQKLFFSRFTMISASSNNAALKSFGKKFTGLMLGGDNEETLELVNRNEFPEFMKRFHVFGKLRDKEHFLGTWLYDEPKETTEILALSLKTNSLKLISNSLQNFLSRGIECYQKGTEQDYFEPNESALNIIREIDGDNVYPDGQEYFLSHIEDFPQHWQEIVTAK